MACAAAATARSIVISRAAELSLKSTFSSPLQLPKVTRPRLPSTGQKKCAIGCLVSGFDGGGVSDEFVSTRKSRFDREFSVIANMLKKIEPLDSSIISKGVSQSAKDSMKQTISTMLGLLPSDQFSVTVDVSKHPLNHLIVSSIVTGYTLWNAEYRTSLMRNFNITSDGLRRPYSSYDDECLVLRWEEGNGRESEKGGGCGGEDNEGVEVNGKELERTNLWKLSPEALSYILQLESELSTIQQEVNAQKRLNLEMKHIKRTNDDLLEYLRSLESDMVNELSRPSSPEVGEIIKQLAQNTLQRFFQDEISSDYSGDSDMSSIQNHQNMDDNELCDSVRTSRDYLAKLLFWCMLLGHHLRGLENRLQLSCVVGLL